MSDTPIATIRIDPSRDPRIAPILESPARFRCMTWGRGGRKTGLGVLINLLACVSGGPYHRGLCVAPKYEQAEEAIYLATQYYPALALHYNGYKHSLNVLGGGIIHIRSTSHPDDIRGKQYSFIHSIESAYITDYSWYHVIRPTLSNFAAGGIIEGTPWSAAWGGWYHTMCKRGEDPEETEVALFDNPLSEAPHTTPEELERLRLTLPRRVWEQEVLGRWLPGGGIVFETIPIEDYAPTAASGRTVMGVDVAKIEDYTVLTALDDKGRVSFFHRMNKLEYPKQAEIIVHWAKKHKSTIYLDATGVGQAMLDLLLEDYDDVVPVTFTRETKRQLIENLVLTFEKGRIILPRSCDILINELQCYMAKVTAMGLKYSAPPGMHDDCVVSLALAAWGASVEAKDYVFA